MSAQETLQPRKRGPKPTGKGTPIQVRLQPDHLAKVDGWREAQDDKPSRPEAIRRLVNERLTIEPWEEDLGYRAQLVRGRASAITECAAVIREHGVEAAVPWLDQQLEECRGEEALILEELAGIKAAKASPGG